MGPLVTHSQARPRCIHLRAIDFGGLSSGSRKLRFWLGDGTRRLQTQSWSKANDLVSMLDKPTPSASGSVSLQQKDPASVAIQKKYVGTCSSSEIGL